MDLFVRGVEAVSRLCGVVAALCLVAACVVVSEMVFMRYVLEASTIWQTEFVLFAVVAATLIGSPYVLLIRGHVNVGLLPDHLGSKGRRVLALVASLVSMGFCAILAWTGAEYWYQAWSQHWVTESVWAPPLWIPVLALPVGTGVLTLQYLADILCLLTGREPPNAPRLADREHEP
jgi:TRAP-type C4-dicarboxylate transport system permease small subunit